MNIAELFVNLGIKGADKTVGALTNVKKGLGETASMSLEAKAGILGAMYALERMFATSGQVGTGLTNFNALTGLSAKQLQQWQFAARQAGVASEEFSGSVKAVQNSMTNMLMGKGAPEGLAMLANQVGFDAKKARDTFYVMEQLQKFARQAPPDVGNAVLKSFGLGEGTIAAMRRNAFRSDVMGRAPTYGDNEIRSLDKANIAWSNLGNKIEMAFGHFNAKHGVSIVQDISKITDQVLRLVEAFTQLADKLKVFKVLNAAAGLLASSLESGNKQIEAIKNPSGYKSPLEPGKTGYLQMWKDAVGNDLNRLKGAITPSTAPTSSKSNQNIHIQQQLNFQHDGKDHKKTSDSVKKANQDAFRQYNQGQVS